jgi:hypothetical protein
MVKIVAKIAFDSPLTEVYRRSMMLFVTREGGVTGTLKAEERETDHTGVNASV